MKFKKGVYKVMVVVMLLALDGSQLVSEEFLNVDKCDLQQYALNGGRLPCCVMDSGQFFH